MQEVAMHSSNVCLDGATAKCKATQLEAQDKSSASNAPPARE